jgi:hypothetical protein
MNYDICMLYLTKKGIKGMLFEKKVIFLLRSREFAWLRQCGSTMKRSTLLVLINLSLLEKRVDGSTRATMSPFHKGDGKPFLPSLLAVIRSLSWPGFVSEVCPFSMP